MTKTRRTRWAALLALPVALTLAACGAQTAPAGSGSDGTVQTTLTIGSVYEHDGFDPLNPLSASANGERLVPVFDTLLRVDSAGEIVPQLAAAMDSPDGKTWTLKLREGVTFTDGTQLDADAVIFNIERHRAPDSPSSSKSLLSDVATLEATDAHTVTFTLNAANWSFPYLFTPSGALGLIGSPEALTTDPEGFNQAPVGAGPYVVKSWVPDDKVTMVANPDYWAGEPEITELTYLVLPDAQARENALLTGQIDITSVTGNFEQLSANSDLTFYTQGNRGGMALLTNASVAPLDDQRVRRAVQAAFDPANSKQVLFGATDLWNGELSCLPFATESEQCEPSAVTTDNAAAKQLVADYVADGKSPKIEILANSMLSKEAQYAEQVLRDIGLEPTIQTVGPGEHIPALYSGEFQLGFWQMVPFDSFYPLGYTIFSGAGRNVPQHGDEALNEALEAAVNGSTIEERNSGLRDAQSIWTSEAYVTWLGPLPQYIVSRAGVDMGDGYLGGFAFYPAEISVTN